MLSREAIINLAEARAEPSWLRNQRLEAAELFDRLPASNFKSDRAVYSEVEPSALEKLIPTQTRESILITCSDPRPKILDFRSALKQEHWSRLIKQHSTQVLESAKEDKFSALALAGFNQGTLIYLPPGQSVRAPVDIKIKLGDRLRIDNLLVVVGSGSELNLVEEVSGSEKLNTNYFGLINLILEEGAKVTYSTLGYSNPKAKIFSLRSAQVQSRAQIKWFDYWSLNALVRSNCLTQLIGLGASAELAGVFLGRDRELYDLAVKIGHQAPQTKSLLKIRGVLDDEAKAIYRGLVKIEREARGADAFQSVDTLVLSDRAEMDPIPALEIKNNEVRCGHAATVGQLDQEKLFYLRSRGLDQRASLALMIEGFLKSAIDLAPTKELREKVSRDVFNNFYGHKSR